jgi:hypothetical protein
MAFAAQGRVACVAQVQVRPDTCNDRSGYSDESADLIGLVKNNVPVSGQNFKLPVQSIRPIRVESTGYSG